MANDRARAVTFEFSTPEIALDDEGFGLHVVDFDGLEVVQRPFRFELNLASRDPEIDFARVVNGPGKLEIVRYDIAGAEYHRSTVHGLVTDFQQGGKDGDQVMYRATLRPRLWALSLTRRSRIFSNRSVPEILRELLDEHEVPHEISLKATYPAHETVVQHHETDLAFFARLATKDGIRFAFRHDDAHDTVILSDAPGQDPWIEGDPEVLYKSHDGLVADKDTEETVLDAFLRERTVPGKVNLQDYNHRTPSAGMDAEDEKSDGKDKRGHHQVFGQHYKDANDGKRLARVRREALHTLAKSITARTVCTRFRAGQRFTLAGHYRKSLDGDYLIACVRHRGGQSQDVGTVGSGGSEGADYQNRVGVLPAAVPYRPPGRGELEIVFPDIFVDASVHLSASATISASMSTTIDFDTSFETHDHHHHGAGGKMFGLMTATIGGSGPYAAVDGDGKYVLQPKFPEGGGSTHSARQVQPYTGAGDAGFHFATEAGNEVIYACLDGDPDRPVILGPVPNPDHPSPVTSGNKSQHIIRTTKKNQLLIEDKEGGEWIDLYSPGAGTGLHLGEASAVDGVPDSMAGGIVAHTAGNAIVQAAGGCMLTTVSKLGQIETGKAIISAVGNIITVLKVAAKIKGVHTYSWDPQGKTGSFVYDLAKIGKKASGTKFGGGINMLSPGAIKLATADAFTIMSLLGIKGYTADSIELAAGRSARLLARESLYLYSFSGSVKAIAHEKDMLLLAKKEIEMRSETDDIEIKADEGKMDLTAKKSINLKAEDEDVTVEAEKRDYKLKAKKKVLIEATDDQMKLDAKGKSIALKAKKSVLIEGDTKVTTKSGRADTLVDKGGKIVLKAGTAKIEMSDSKIEFKLGPSTIKMSASGIEIKGPQVKINAQVKAELKAGAMLTLQGSAMAELKGGIVMIN